MKLYHGTICYCTYSGYNLLNVVNFQSNLSILLRRDTPNPLCPLNRAGFFLQKKSRFSTGEIRIQFDKNLYEGEGVSLVVA